MTASHERKRKIALLVRDLEVLRASAGATLGMIEKRSAKLEGTPAHGVRIARLPKSTVSDLLRRDRVHALRPELVESLWAVLLLIATDGARTPLLPDSLRGLDALRRRLESINVPERAHAVPGPADPADRTGIAEPGGTGPGVLDPFGAPPGGDEETDRQWLLDSAAAARPRTWWYDGRDLVPDWLERYLTLEPPAAGVRVYAPHAVPGLLQTPEYAAAALRRERPLATPAELSVLLNLRMRRQEPLWRQDALQLWAIIDENVLRDGICGPTAMNDQLDHLIKVAATRHITIQVMSREAHGHNATGGPVTLLRFTERGFPDVVLVEQHHHGLYPEESGDVSAYQLVLDRLAIEALPPKESLQFLQSLRQSGDMIGGPG
ncbi:DUF5753 domain-containing protein [Spirillospora sp. NPDC029432]|uniref:DUF5753 domain-containing protein n=1 Tax=Spirillospora sp. NPDC029432 TaxID=3154599 RepID=UPI0034516953